MKTCSFPVGKWTKVLPIALLGFMVPSTHAATVTWDGGAGGSFLWSDGNNWVDGAAPVAGSDVVFNGAVGATNTNNLTGNPIYHSLNFNAGFTVANGTSASANAFSISNGLTTTGTHTYLASNITLTAAQTIAAKSNSGSRILQLNGALAIGANAIEVDAGSADGTKGNDIQFIGVVSGSGDFTKNGLGLWTLGNNANTFTGNVIVNAGTLSARNSQGLGTGAGTTTIANGAALQLAGTDGTVAEAITVSGVGSSTTGVQRGAISSFGNFNFSGPITFAGSTTIGMRQDYSITTISGNIGESLTGSGLEKVGSWANLNAGFLKLSGNNSYTGMTSVIGGGLIVNGQHGAATSEATRVGSYSVTSETISTLTSQSVLAGTGTVYLKSAATVQLTGASAALRANLAPGDVSAVTLVNSFTSSIGTLVINAATHAPGTAAVVFGDNSQLSIQIDSTKVGGTADANDRLTVVGGDIDLTGNSDYLVINLLGAGTLSGDYVIATFDSITPALYGTFDHVTGLPSGYQLYYNATNITLGVAAVPEPGTVGLLGLGILTALSARRIRRKMIQ